MTERIDDTQEVQTGISRKFQVSASDFFLESDELLSHPHRFHLLIYLSRLLHPEVEALPFYVKSARHAGAARLSGTTVTQLGVKTATHEQRSCQIDHCS